MIGRVIWSALLVAIAFVTSAAQLDRQARVSPTLASLVPEPFRGFAQARVASNAVVGDDPALGLTEAKRLVERRPIPAEHVRLLANAQLKAEQVDDGVVTVQLAARRGWRDPLSQEAMLRLALGAGDYPEAARRYAALFLNNRTEDASLTELGEQVFAEPHGAGRETFTEIVTGGERWHGLFLNRGPRVMPDDAFVEIVAESRANGAQFECPPMERASAILSNRQSNQATTFQTIVTEVC